uniref:Mediator of RNA polymerase II transcription subunit 14 n=1 Tax=Rhizophora mucronata TaxID=61149 RepID=A0A2P2JID9_RHIMU
MDLDFSTNSLGERNDSSTALLTSIENPLFYCLKSAIPPPSQELHQRKEEEFMQNLSYCLYSFCQDTG